jgi:hypothetical protein
LTKVLDQFTGDATTDPSVGMPSRSYPAWHKTFVVLLRTGFIIPWLH